MQLTPKLIKSESEIPHQFRWVNLANTAPSKHLGYESPPTGADLIYPPIPVAKEAGDLKLAEVEYPYLGYLKPMTAVQALELLDQARIAFDSGRGIWASAPYQKRIEAVLAFATDLERIEEQVALAIMWEIAKTWADSLAEVRRTVDYIRETCKAYEQACISEGTPIIEQGFFAKTRRVPLGITLCMGPFNYPLNETYTTLIPALLVGNSVLMKPAKIGILLHNPILPLFEKHFPKGVVGLILGDGKELITPLMKSGFIDALAFIGSSAVANAITSQHPKPNRMRCILGLEAKNVGVILPEADLAQTAKECVQGALTFNGQRCTALKMLFVHSSIHDRFVTLLAEQVEALTPGMPWEEKTQITPLAEPGKCAWLDSLIADAKATGATVVNPAVTPSIETLFHPTIVTDVGEAAKLSRVEQFGPVIPVRKFDDVMEVVHYVEKSNYGQQASVFGSSTEAAFLVDALSKLVARVNINTQCRRGPDTFAFGGRKDSAAGTLSVRDALRCFSIRSVVSCKADKAQSEQALVAQLVASGNNFLKS